MGYLYCRTHSPSISKCLSEFTLILSASLCFLSIPSPTFVLYLPNVSTDIMSSWFLPISFHTFSPTLSHSIPARPFATFSHTSLSTMSGSLFFWHAFLTLYWHYFNFIASLFDLSGYIPTSSALDAALLVVLGHPSIVLPAAVCTVSGCFTNFAFLSHTSLLHILAVVLLHSS